MFEVRLLKDLLVSIESWQSFAYFSIRVQNLVKDRSVLRCNLYKNMGVRTNYHSSELCVLYLQHQLDRSLCKQISLQCSRAFFQAHPYKGQIWSTLTQCFEWTGILLDTCEEWSDTGHIS